MDAPSHGPLECWRVDPFFLNSIRMTLFLSRSTDPLTKKGKLKMEKFMKALDIDVGNEKEVSDCEKVFKLIDKDDDGKIDFPELMIFMFTIDEELSR